MVGDETGNSVKNSVNLASYILGADSPKRVVGDGGIKVENSYSLLSTRIGKNVVEAVTIISEDVIGQDGADISLQQARTASFYAETLKWDMESTWIIPLDGESYPVLKWQLERESKIQTGLYVGIEVQPAQITERLYLSMVVMSYHSLFQRMVSHCHYCRIIRKLLLLKNKR